MQPKNRTLGNSDHLAVAVFEWSPWGFSLAALYGRVRACWQDQEAVYGRAVLTHICGPGQGKERAGTAFQVDTGRPGVPLIALPGT